MTLRADLLVVDDEPVLLSAVRKICETEGLAVDDASTAKAGLVKLSRGGYRLLLCDLMLSGIGGIGLLEAAGRDSPETPVVMITGYATRERTAECFLNGAFDVLPKPFDEHELLASVRRALGFLELERRLRSSMTLADFLSERRAADLGPADLYSLGMHAWVSLEPNGSVRIGAGESFRSTDEEVRAVRTAAVDSETLQGDECASITTADGLVHRVWSPVSGRVLETNTAWEKGCPAIDSLSDHWLIGAVPTDLESELAKLTRR